VRYSIRYLAAVAAVVFAILLLALWANSNKVELTEAHAEAQQLKADLDAVKAERDKVRAQGELHKLEYANFKNSLKPIRDGEEFPRPALEFENLDKVGEFLGYNSIHLFRWRGGTLEGWVQFQTEAEPVKLDLEVSKNAKRFVLKDQIYDPRAVSGEIMIAVKTRKDKITISDCLVGIRYWVKRKDGTIGSSYTLSGAIDAEKAKTDWSWKGMSVGMRQIGNETVGDFSRGGQLAFDEKRDYLLYKFKVSTDPGK
jgi:hypothetical protein